jgi:ankyrin repeat protein
VEIATLLLDHGAHPGSSWNDGWDNPFTAITLAIGEGEGAHPPHPEAEALIALLLDRGADPFDTQTFYDVSITDDETKWLDVLWARAEARGETGRWSTAPTKIGGRIPMSALDFMLSVAVSYRHHRMIAWLLERGANAVGVNAYSGRPHWEEAQLYGDVKIADLLIRHGAKETPLEDGAAFQAAAMRLDAEAARTIAARTPMVLQDADVMITAARQGCADVIGLLLDLGMPVDVADGTLLRGLQAAIQGSRSLEAVKLLVERGADIDRPTIHYGGGMGFAAHFQARQIALYLAPRSRDVWNMVSLSLKERLAELFAAEPALVNALHPRSGVTPLHCLPGDDEAAADVAAFLLKHGADPTIRSPKGSTPEDAARERGLFDAAEVIAGGP